MAAGKTRAAALGAFIVLEDEAGFSMTPPTARTWGRRGHTPVVRVRGRSWRRFSIAAMCCYKPGKPSRLIYRPRQDRHHRGSGRRDTFTDDEHLEHTLRRGLRHIQNRPDLIDGCLADTGLTITNHHPTPSRRDQYVLGSTGTEEPFDVNRGRGQ